MAYNPFRRSSFSTREKKEVKKVADPNSQLAGVWTNLKCSDILDKKSKRRAAKPEGLVILRKDSTVEEAWKLMYEHNSTAAVVYDDSHQQVISLLTFADILELVLRKLQTFRPTTAGSHRALAVLRAEAVDILEQGGGAPKLNLNNSVTGNDYERPLLDDKVSVVADLSGMYYFSFLFLFFTCTI